MLKTLFLILYIIKCQIKHKKIIILTRAELIDLIRKTHNQDIRAGWDSCLEHINNRRETISVN